MKTSTRWRWAGGAAVAAAAACKLFASDGRPPLPGGSTWHGSNALGVELGAPADADVRETAGHAHVGNGTFKLNLFTVDAWSPASADDQKALVELDPGFVKFTREEPGATTWRFDYLLTNGKAATVSRVVAGRPLDCEVYGVTTEVAAAVASACATVKPL